MSKKFFNLIVAKTYLKNGIGKDGGIPWKLSDDLKHFKKITTSNNNTLNSVIMGKNTWNSLSKRPLKNRLNIIVSKTLYNENNNKLNENILYTSNFNNALKISNDFSNNTYVIGGEKIYEEALQHSLCNKLYITDIYNKYKCDTYFPQINENEYTLTNISKFLKEGDIDYRYLIYEKDISKYNRYEFDIKYNTNKEEYQLLRLMKDILTYGTYKENRTDTNIYSLFSPTKLYYNLGDTYPIATTKKIFLRGIFEELMFILRGQTNNKILIDKNINIWTANTTQEFLNKNNVGHLKENDMGETYGFNMRYFNENYIDCNSKHINLKPNSDQLIYLINLLKYNPDSRRMIVNLWNPTSLNNCSLPPCLMLFQFNITKNKLNLQATLRSSDVYLANAWNTTYCALFVHLLCNIEGINLTPGELSINIGDAHIYENHLDGVNEQLKRTPKPYPKLEVLNKKKIITDFEFDDIKLIGYNPYKNTDNMKVDMIV